MKFVWMAEVVDDTHERSAASLGNPVVEYYNVVIITFQGSFSPTGWLERETEWILKMIQECSLKVTLNVSLQHSGYL